MHPRHRTETGEIGVWRCQRWIEGGTKVVGEEEEGQARTSQQKGSFGTEELPLGTGFGKRLCYDCNTVHHYRSKCAYALNADGWNDQTQTKTQADHQTDPTKLTCLQMGRDTLKLESLHFRFEYGSTSSQLSSDSTPSNPRESDACTWTSGVLALPASCTASSIGCILL